jgi:5-methyltetrahydrofolate--homocysteine methyltransferase
MTDLTEACLAIRAVRQLDADVPILATMTFQETPRGFRTIMGVTVADAVRGLVTAGANVVGSNCGNGIGLMVDIAQAFREASEHPVMIQANAGVPELRGGVVHYPETPEDFAAAVPLLKAAGASIIGGCCGTDPAHIRAIRHTIS